ncbi:ACT domain-containing protein [Actinotalea sp. M2MS4P-6]|uniref:glycine cleavage system protein R n=1 Tax=Actinotalea sp. M2MS4P-6 TaxID=2983762 RepID=UPI0021E3BB33|nr:ACT domain-containing protein [Actinotalea sp. M2MS4P-6]MCV2393735.1 ACT domain-containing protein [Actinotalea sp. M2MS4P-6]
MTTLVLTVIGDDRAGLVKALADVVSAHDGNWERSHLAELAGKFAGIVEVSVPPARAAELQEALRRLSGLLDVEVQTGTAGPTGTDEARSAGREVLVEVLGNDHPGIVHAVSAALAEHGLSVTELETSTREAPMVGGRLFEARALVAVPDGFDLAELRATLEQIASEVLVDLTLSAHAPS